MRSVLLLIMALILLYVIWQIGRQLYLKTKCVDDEDIYLFVKGKMDRQSGQYKRIAEHLLTCEKCRDQMRMIQFGKDLDEHLVS